MTLSVSTLRWQPLVDGPPDAPADARALACVRFDPASVESGDTPLTWLDGDFKGEVWHVEHAPETGYFGDWQFRHVPGIAFASLAVGARADSNIAQSAEQAYLQLFELQARLGLPNPARVWHWLSEPTAGDGEAQRYRQVCRGRAQALEAAPPAWAALPPATLVAGGRPGLTLHALLCDQPITPIENPRQISAYHYPSDYAERAPAFARGGLATLGASDFLMLSGTASIVGHESRHIGDLAAQIDEALTNVATVLDAGRPGTTLSDLQCLKAYLRRPEDSPALTRQLRSRLGNVPIAVLHAPLCRDDLLVEFEGQVALGG